MNGKVQLGVFSVVAVIVAIVIICFLWNDNEVSYSRRGHYHVRSLEPVFLSSKLASIDVTPLEYIVVIEADTRKGADLDTTSVTGVTVTSVGGVTPVATSNLTTVGNEYVFISSKLMIVKVSAVATVTSVVQTYNTTTNILTLTFA